jgi:hypothetical protein
MLNLSRLLYSKEFNQTFIVHRRTGSWDHGRFVSTEVSLTFSGVVVPASAREIMQFPEGDRSTSMMVFYSDKEMFVTRTDSGDRYPGTSDEIEWRGDRYRVVNVGQYGDYGYFVAYGVYMEGD